MYNIDIMDIYVVILDRIQQLQQILQIRTFWKIPHSIYFRMITVVYVYIYVYIYIQYYTCICTYKGIYTYILYIYIYVYLYRKNVCFYVHISI